MVGTKFGVTGNTASACALICLPIHVTVWKDKICHLHNTAASLKSEHRQRGRVFSLERRDELNMAFREQANEIVEKIKKYREDNDGWKPAKNSVSIKKV